MNPAGVFTLVIMASCLNEEVTAVRVRRDLPIIRTCDPRSNAASNKCYKGDLVDTSVADCERDTNIPPYESDSFSYKCQPIIRGNAFESLKSIVSSVVDVPDTILGVDCKPVSGLPIRCGTQSTRCVCDAPFDTKAPYLSSNCRCQYWPHNDVREQSPAFCTQRDHGGYTGIHFYACCNNCNDPDTSCDRRTYQGGRGLFSDPAKYCGSCGETDPPNDGRETYHFNCGSCQEQNACEKRCDEIHYIAKNLPGLCPKWLGCFRGCCLELNPSYRGRRDAGSNSNVSIPNSFCGDAKCQNGENRYNCPTDCCSGINPDMCPEKGCHPNCCEESNCCMEATTAGTDQNDAHRLAVPGILLQLLVSILTARY